MKDKYIMRICLYFHNDQDGRLFPFILDFKDDGRIIYTCDILIQPSTMTIHSVFEEPETRQ